MLNTISLEEADAAIVHPHGKVDNDLVFGLTQNGGNVEWNVSETRGFLEVALDNAEEVISRLGWGDSALGLNGRSFVGTGAHSDISSVFSQRLQCAGVARGSVMVPVQDPPRGLHPHRHYVEIRNRTCDQESVRPVEDATVTREDSSRVLYADGAFEEALT